MNESRKKMLAAGWAVMAVGGSVVLLVGLLSPRIVANEAQQASKGQQAQAASENEVTG